MSSIKGTNFHVDRYLFMLLFKIELYLDFYVKSYLVQNYQIINLIIIILYKSKIRKDTKCLIDRIVPFS